jgi:hypothetical protein
MPPHSDTNAHIFSRLYGGSKRNGFVVEAGANDGLTISNSLYFELKHNWTGLLVEPDPIAFQTLLTANRK